jgi:RHS repeat-associated protein
MILKDPRHQKTVLIQRKSIRNILTSVFMMFIYLYAIIVPPIVQAEELKNRSENYQKENIKASEATTKIGGISNKASQQKSSRNQKVEEGKIKNLEQGSENQIFSNAYNFATLLKQGVDSRTGVYQFSMVVGQAYGKNLSLPFTLNLNYLQNPSAKDRFGFGNNWDLNLTYYDADSSMLYLSGEQAFKVNFNGDTPYLQYDKGLNIRLENNGGEFIIISKDGYQQFLNRDGNLKQISDSVGNSLYFNYDNDGVFKSISDDPQGKNVKMLFDWGSINTYVYSLSADGSWLETRIDISSVGNSYYVSKIFLPQKQKETEDESPGFELKNIQYTFLLESILLPSNAKIFLQYTDLLSQNNWKVKAVSKYMIQPEDEEASQGAKIEINYNYDNGDGHNYLGHNGTPTMQAEDPLYGTENGYQYQTGVNNGLTYVVTTYNKYHLIEKQETYDASQISTTQPASSSTFTISNSISSTWKLIYNWFLSIFTSHLNNSSSEANIINLGFSKPLNSISYKYPVDLSKAFDELPNNYAQPTEKNTVIGARMMTTTANYDKETGNMLSSTDATGMTKDIAYCKVDEESENCKPDPSGFEKHVKSVTLTAAPSVQKDILDIYKSIFYYQKLNSNKQGLSSIVVPVRSEQSFNETIYSTGETEFNDSGDFYGYPKLSIVGDNSKSLINSYDYRFDGNNIVIRKAYGREQNVFEDSAINKFVNRPAYEVNAQGVKVIYTYDDWGRVLTQTAFAGTDKEKTTAYEYYMNKPDPDEGSQSSNYVIITSPQGYKTKIVMDGLGREIKSYKLSTDADRSASNSAKFLLINETSYDKYGRKESVIVHNVVNSNGQMEEVTATTKLKYDILGRSTEVVLPDGVKKISEYDDNTNSSKSYILSTSNKKSSISQKFLDNSDRLVRESILDPLTNAEVYYKVYTYDGFGRLSSTADSNSAITSYSYDAKGRIFTITSPNYEKVTYTYDIFDKVTSINITDKDGKVTKTLGSRTYDDLGRIATETNTYKFTTTYNYDQTTGNLNSIHVPKGNDGTKFNTIRYSYDNVTHQLLSRSVDSNPNEMVSYSYDSKTLAINQIKDKTGTSNFSYYTDGSLKSVVHGPEGGIPEFKTSEYKISYDLYDRLGNIVLATDANNNVTTYIYNKYGRIDEIQYSKLNGGIFETAKYAFDEFDRLQSETLQSSHVSRDYTYDNFSRLASLTNKLNDKSVTKFEFDYYGDGNLQTRTRTNGISKTATENYTYDNMNNLSGYECTGELCPKDQLGNQLKTEKYTFDGFNNISTVDTSFINSPQANTTTYTYDTTAPMRLVSYTNTLSSVFPNSQKMVYDSNGHVTLDDKGNKYSYNELGQTIAIHSSAGSLSASYIYDYSGRQVVHIMPNQDPLEMIYGVNSLANERQGNKTVSYLFGMKGKLARFVSDVQTQHQISTYFAFDQSGTIVNEMSGSSLSSLVMTHERAFTPYGVESTLYKDLNQQEISAYIDLNEFGFDGQRTDSQSGLQFLGDGYRAYNPLLRHFMSYDSMSPFSKGGINGYSFGNNNPIMFGDPSGHMSVGGWVGMIFGFIAGIAVTVLTAGAGAAAVGVLGIAEGTTVATLTSAAVNIGLTAAAGAALGAAGQVVNNAIDGKSAGMNVAEAAGWGALGGVIGGFSGEAVSGVSSFMKGATQVDSEVAIANSSITLTNDSKLGVEAQNLSTCPGGSCSLGESACFTGNTLIAKSAAPINEETVGSKEEFVRIQDIEVGDWVLTSPKTGDSSSLENSLVEEGENKNGIKLINKYLELIKKSEAWLHEHVLDFLSYGREVETNPTLI